MSAESSIKNSYNTEKINTSDLVSRASTIGPKLFEMSHETAKKRSLPNKIMEMLVDARVLRACMPKRFGGYELPFGAHTDVAMELAKFCGSTGWVSGIIGSHNWWLGKYEPEAQHEVWDNSPDAIVGAAFASKPKTHATKFNGGFKVSGTWMWCSGVEHCDWVSLMTPIIVEKKPPELCMILLSKEEYQIDDVWFSPGMRGTGSNNVNVEDLFVPSHRITKISELNSKDSPGNQLNTSSVYKLPMLDVFGYSVAIPTLGCSYGTLNHFIEGMKERIALDNAKIAEFQSQQLRAAESSVELDCALEIYRSDLKKCGPHQKLIKTLTRKSFLNSKEIAHML